MAGNFFFFAFYEMMMKRDFPLGILFGCFDSFLCGATRILTSYIEADFNDTDELVRLC